MYVCPVFFLLIRQHSASSPRHLSSLLAVPYSLDFGGSETVKVAFLPAQLLSRENRTLNVTRSVGVFSLDDDAKPSFHSRRRSLMEGNGHWQRIRLRNEEVSQEGWKRVGENGNYNPEFALISALTRSEISK